MNLNINGHHLEVTPAIRNYVIEKLDRVKRHFDHVIDASVTISVVKLVQRADVTLHVRGKDIHAEASHGSPGTASQRQTDQPQPHPHETPGGRRS